MSFDSEDESGDGWDDDGTGWLSSLISLRADIAAGDYRALYLAWLLCVQEREVGPHAPEPPIPPGLGKLTAPLRALADFMRIDPDLIAVASERSTEVRSGRQLDRWVAALSPETKSDLLVRFAAGDSQAARAKLLRRFRDGENRSPGVNPRMPAQLLAAGKQRTVERQRKEAERAEAAARERHLVRLAKREAQTWRHVEALVAARKQSDYDEAVRLLRT